MSPSRWRVISLRPSTTGQSLWCGRLSAELSAPEQNVRENLAAAGRELADLHALQLLTLECGSPHASLNSIDQGLCFDAC